MDQYVFDADALINLYNHFSKAFYRLRRLAKHGQIKVPEGIYRELRRKTDKLFKRVDKWGKDYPRCIVRIRQDQRLKRELSRVEQAYGDRIQVSGKEYPGFWKSRAGRKAYDGQVVAIGKVHECVVVSDDLALRLACMLEDVQCIGWTEFARRIGMQQEQQLELGIDESTNP